MGIIVFLWLYLISFSVSAQDKIYITIYGDEANFPYSYEKNGTMYGIYTDIIKKVSERLPNYVVTLQNIPWKRGLSFLESGEAFALYSPYYRPTERPYIEYYSEPLFDEAVTLFCDEAILKDRQNLKWPEDFYGLIIGNNLGFSMGGDNFWNAVKKGNIKVKERKTTKENLLSIGGDIHCYMNDKIATSMELNTLKKSGLYNEVSQKKLKSIVEKVTISKESGYLAITKMDQGKFPFKKDFLDQFNAQFKEMKNSGEIKKITDNALAIAERIY